MLQKKEGGHGNILMYTLIGAFIIGAVALVIWGSNAITDLDYSARHPNAANLPFLVLAYDPQAGHDASTGGLTYLAVSQMHVAAASQRVVGELDQAKFTDFADVVGGSTSGTLPAAYGWTNTSGFVMSPSNQMAATEGQTYPAWMVIRAPTEVAARQIFYNISVGISGLWPLSQAAADAMHPPDNS